MSETEYTKAFKAGYDFGYKDAANENRYNTGVKVGIAYEQDRIIKLLEEEFNDTWPTGVAFVETSLPNLIELIKGETNE
jgi:hypothetical protein